MGFVNYDQGEEPNYGRNAMLGTKAPEAVAPESPRLTHIPAQMATLLNQISELDAQIRRVNEMIGGRWPAEAAGNASNSDKASDSAIEITMTQIAEASRRLYNISGIVEMIGARI